MLKLYLALITKLNTSWTVAGSIRYRLKNETTARRVKSVFDIVEAILAQK